jgi:hypothetical protein
MSDNFAEALEKSNDNINTRVQENIGENIRLSVKMRLDYY